MKNNALGSLLPQLLAVLIMAGYLHDVRAQDDLGDVSAVPLYDDLGDHHMAISTDVALAQRYFDQGMRLYYAFNHAEAIRAFSVAQSLDPQCAICFWGEALAWGPNINLPMDSPSAQAAYQAIQQALALNDHALAKERDLIAALAVRYTAAAPEERGHLDQAYADAMAQVAASYPQDSEVAVLYAESLMDLRPWDYWNAAGQAQPGIETALAKLQQVMAVDANHPGACHFYIHAVEAVYPERAIECAERLAALMPGAGHLVHMPGHIYIRVGRYLEAVEVNEHAVHADESYIQDQNPQIGMYTAGYYPHNYDFMAFAAMMIGRGDLAISSAEKVTSLLPPELFGAPGMDFLQHWSVRPLLLRVRFSRWDEILDTAQPAADQPHARALWHYARGRAYLGLTDLTAADQELAALRALNNSDTLQGLKMEFNASEQLVAIAERILTGWCELAGNNPVQGTLALREAVTLEDQLFYGEPPEWTVPARHDLGEALLKLGELEMAESVFREDLAKFPENGWSLQGLQATLQRQGKSEEAREVQQRLDRIWATADVAHADRH